MDSLPHRLQRAVFEALREIEDAELDGADLTSAVELAEKLRDEVMRLRDCSRADLQARSEDP